MVGDAIDQRIFEPLLDGVLAPSRVLLFSLRAGALEFLGERDKPLGRVLVAVEHDVLAGLAQLRIDLLIDGELAGVDDAHVHPRLNGVIEEDGVHRLTHRLIAAEGEGEVRDAARDMGRAASSP